MPTETPTPPITPEASATPTETGLPAVALLPTDSIDSGEMVLPPSRNGTADDYLKLMAATFATSAATLGWLWFLVGSIIFFAVAGMFAGLGYRQRESRRYRIVDEELAGDDWAQFGSEQFDGEQFAGQFEEEFPPIGTPFAEQSFATDRAAAGSPFNRPAPVTERQENESPRGATAQDEADDDYWPASLP